MRTKILTGLGVSKGTARGKVRIIENPQDNDFQEGEILVTHLTNPEMVIMMGKAAGIICNIGGMTSHPSIVSREMGTPCIVSAKSEDKRKATEVLKDGMTVEVNGETGEVHLVEEPKETENLDWADEFVEAAVRGFGGMDLNTLEPIDCFHAMPLYAKSGVERMLEFAEKAEQSNLNAKELAKSLFSPSVIRIELMLAIIKAKMVNFPQEKIAKLARFYNNLLQAWCTEDPHAKQGKNKVHSKEEVAEIMKKVKPATPEIAKALGRLSSSCYHLSYGLYSDINPQLCYENFGPYDVNENKILIVKQFQDLNPKVLWPGRLDDFPYNLVRIYTVYENVKFSMDAISHAHFEGDLINNLRHYAVEINGKLVDILEVKQATETISLKSIEMWKLLRSLEFEAAKVKYLDQRCYNYINICKKLGLDWKPTQEMLTAVKDKPLVKDYFPSFESPEDEGEFWTTLIDPRVTVEELTKKYPGFKVLE